MPGKKTIMLRSSCPYLVIVLEILFFNARQNQPIATTGVGPTPDDAKPAVPGPTDRPPAPSPSAAAPLTSFPATAGTVDDRRRPGPGITASAVLPDGSFWYAFELFDSMGGSTPGSQNQGLYRWLDGQVTHFVIPGAVRVLAAAPDNALYIGAGCGLLRFHAETVETLLEVDCEDQGRPLKMFPIAIAFANDGLVWVGGFSNLASFDGQSWQEYKIPALKVAIGPDGTVWAQGWDGRQGSDCCVTHLTHSGPISYLWSADMPAPPELLDKLFGLHGR